MISVSVLGPVELHRDGVLVPVRPGKTTEVLVRLALEAGVMVRTDRLIEDLWAGEAVRIARNPLQTKVSRLRRSLGDGSLVSGTRAGYVLHIEPDRVDALEVLRLAGEAMRLRAGGEPAAAVAVCTTALAMFHGEVLPDAGDGDWVVPFRVRLDEARLGLVEEQLAARLELGAGSDIVAELEALVNLHPLREGLWASLITALYRSGRQADALAAYTRVRAALAEQLGLEPGPPLQALEHQVLLQDTILDGNRSPARSTSRRVSHLPAVTSPMTGREVDVAAVRGRTTEARVLTVVGPAGIGKTRLAVEVASTVERADGACLVRLEGTRDAATVAAALADALDVNPRSDGAVVDHLRGSDLLLVLDNCEQVVDAVAELVARLIAAAPWVNVLCTSQLPLGLDGESVYALAALSLADSVELFAQRAVRHRPSFVVPEGSEPTVESVCRSLDGLPLAIELAAARTRTLSIEEISRRLDDRFALLRDPTSRRPERQRALEAAIAWSYDLLFPDDQRGLWTLACFADGAPLAGIEHVLAALEVPSESAADVVSRLADRSLIAVDFSADGGPARYRLLDSIRAFALERLHDAALDEAAQHAQADWIAALSGSAAAALRGPQQAEHLRTCRQERTNIDATLAWTAIHDPALGLRIATGFGWAWVLLGDGRLGSERITAALSAMPATSAEDQVRPLSFIAWLEVTSNIELAHRAAEQAVAAANTTGDPSLAVFSRSALALVLIQNGAPDQAISMLNESRQLLDDTNPWDLGGTWILTAHAALALGDTVAAGAASTNADRLLRPLGDDWILDHLDGLLGYIAQAEQRYDDAATHLRQAAGAAKRLGYASTEASHLDTLGRVLEQAGQVDEAVATLERVIEIGRSTRQLRLLALGRVHLGRVLRAHGDRDAGLLAVRAADHWFESSGGGDGAALAACLHAAMDAEDGDASAEGRLWAAVERAREQHAPEIEIMALDALARRAANADDLAAARDLLETADALMPSAAHLLSAADRLDADHANDLIVAGATGP